MANLKKLESDPAVVRTDFVRDMKEQIRRIFNPILGKFVLVISKEYIQITIFPKRGELKWVGDEPIITEQEG